jgi:hypothetical protein
LAAAVIKIGSPLLLIFHSIYKQKLGFCCLLNNSENWIKVWLWKKKW